MQNPQHTWTCTSQRKNPAVNFWSGFTPLRKWLYTQKFKGVHSEEDLLMLAERLELSEKETVKWGRGCVTFFFLFFGGEVFAFSRRHAVSSRVTFTSIGSISLLVSYWASLWSSINRNTFWFECMWGFSLIWSFSPPTVSVWTVVQNPLKRNANTGSNLNDCLEKLFLRSYHFQTIHEIYWEEVVSNV